MCIDKLIQRVATIAVNGAITAAFGAIAYYAVSSAKDQKELRKAQIRLIENNEEEESK